MELRHLQTFAAAAERESFTRAAEALELTQAAVSQHISALEAELSVELFLRQRRGVQLTDPGRTLYEYARRIFDLIDEAVLEVSGTAPQVTGTLRIATSTVPSEWLLPELLAKFRQACPDVRESLAVSDSSVATAAVLAGEADLGFVGELPRTTDLVVQPVAEDELVLVVAADHRLAEQRTASLAQLRREPLIVREPGSGSRRCVEQALEEHGLAPSDLTIAMEANSNDAIRAAVQRGVGVAFLSQRAVPQKSGLATLKIRGCRPRRQLYLIRDPRHALPPAARQFLAFIEQCR